MGTEGIDSVNESGLAGYHPRWGSDAKNKAGVDHEAGFVCCYHRKSY